MNSNGRKILTNLKGTLPQYGNIWFSNDAIANILSMAKVKNMCHVSYNSKVKDVFIVEKDGRTMRFKRSNGGLYYFNTKNKEACFMQSVKENKK
eukprot:9994559-Ditylum_brightwellii.AAC.1